jgi:adenylate cyclase
LAPLVWAHAFALDTILSGSFVVPLGELFSTLLVILAGLGSALAAGVLRPAAATATVTGAATAYWGTALLAFGGETRLALPLLAPTLAGVLGYGASTLARHWAEEREKRALAGALSRYLSPAVTRRVLREPEGLRLGGRRKELTVLCAEVDGFSDLSERLEPEEIDAFLAAFFSAVTDVVFKYEGTLDHFTGQGVRAFFGDPEPQEDHALRGVRCAVEMRGRAADVVQSWARDGRPALQVGIGVHTGYVTVGNVGSLQRMEYTVIGRNVDQAARLARAEPGRILVSPRTRALTAEAVTYEARSGADGRPTCFEALTAR